MVALHRGDTEIHGCRCPLLSGRALLPSAWHVSFITSCYFEVIYLASDPLLEMPICFHTPVKPDNILTIQLLSDKFYF